MRLLITAVVAVACACGSPQRATRSDVTAPLPALSLPLLDGGTWSSADARGSVLVIDVWASWCKPCGKGFPSLEELARTPGVKAVAISIDDDASAARAFLVAYPLSVPVAHDVDRALMADPLRVTSLPAVLIVDAQGNVRHHLEKLHESDYADIRRLVGELVHTSR